MAVAIHCKAASRMEYSMKSDENKYWLNYEAWTVIKASPKWDSTFSASNAATTAGGTALPPAAAAGASRNAGGAAGPPPEDSDDEDADDGITADGTTQVERA
eukprot:CAMPEP_0174899232 /NCGR_PEP_ID=MMETSP0167-20121228/25982_1 /TAXON_ID=38298 /ORGANISM="Rhodella maculata, Strain CCMP736" /LENGTH=101 /DNA_ID=CAMNT_0016140151 /DNA_START=12 /DNA_END=317 /DNA_ORIENTATION=-